MNKPAPKGDTTSTRRSSNRMATLNKIAGEAGYFNKYGEPSWSAFETAVMNGNSRIPKNKEKPSAKAG
jgi:hypothetical protein